MMPDSVKMLQEDIPLKLYIATKLMAAMLVGYKNHDYTMEEYASDAMFAAGKLLDEYNDVLRSLRAKEKQKNGTL